MRHQHLLYLSKAMTQLQVVAQTHRASKSQILQRALRHYLTFENNDQPHDRELINIRQEATSRSLGRLKRDLAIAVELTATFVRYFLMITSPSGRAGCGAGTGGVAVRSGDRERSKASQDGPTPGCTRDDHDGPEAP
jgi:hypothetical protein